MKSPRDSGNDPSHDQDRTTYRDKGDIHKPGEDHGKSNPNKQRQPKMDDEHSKIKSYRK